MSNRELKEVMKETFLKFSIALSAIYSVLPAKAAEMVKSKKQASDISISVTPKANDDVPTINLADSVQAIQQLNNSDLSKKYLEQMKLPIVLEDGGQKNIDNYATNARVGDLDFLALNMQSKKHSTVSKKTNFKQPKDLIKQANINLVDENSPLLNKDALAVCSTGGKIYLKVFDNNEEKTDTVVNGIQGIEEYKAGNIIAMISTLTHEAVHLKHNLYDNMKDLAYPADIYRTNRATEKMAYAAQNMYLAQLYTILKSNNISSLEIGNKKILSEDILDYCPGLKDYVLKNGFSPNSQKDVDAVSKIASDYWNEHRQNGYRIQNTLAAAMRHKSGNLFETVATDKKAYDTTINKMLKNVYIGNNTNVNLSREFFDDFTFEDALNALKDVNIARNFTVQQVQKLDAYLTSINITDNEAKVTYLKENFDHMVLRDGNYDVNLQKVLLDTASENKGTIVYADGLTEKWQDGKHTISGELGEADISLFAHINNLKDKVTDTKTAAKQGQQQISAEQIFVFTQRMQNGGK